MKIFIDCGYYRGKALEYYAPFMDETWEVIAFEPRADLGVQSSFERSPFDIEWYQIAVWTENGDIDYVIPNREDSAHILKDRGVAENEVIKKVSSIDFSQFVDSLPEEATIVVSMDIEGAEFPVLKKMIKDGTIERISLLDIEFHHRLIPGMTREDSDHLRREIEVRGTLVKLKLEL